MASRRTKILFLIDHARTHFWRDGLWAAIEYLKKDFDIDTFNLTGATSNPVFSHDFLLGWGAFRSRVDNFMQESKRLFPHVPMGLCVAGNAFPPDGKENYDVLFYETEWYKSQISDHPHICHAFGINSNIFNHIEVPKVWDYLSVGAFALWKRQEKILDKVGTKLVVGEVQQNNLPESVNIIGKLILGGTMVSDVVYPTRLRDLYNMSKCVYIPAELNGGGERAVLEARACGCEVEVEPDNPKLQELLSSPIWDEVYYAEQLKNGILKCIGGEKANG